MKRLSVSAVLSVVAILGLTLDSQAGHFRHQNGGYNDCCVTECNSAPAQYVDQKVTRYRQVMVEKEIDVVVCRQVNREEKFNYTVQVPVTRQEVRKQTFYNTVQKEVEYNYTVCVPVTVAENRKVTTFNRVEKEVDYTYTVMVPRTEQRKVNRTTYQCTTENVVETVPVCRLVRVSCVDECGRCYTRCERVTTMEQVTRCVVRRVPVTQEVVVNVVVCEAQTRQGKRIVCDFVPVVQDVVVNVCRIEHQARVGKRIVCELVPEVRDVNVTLCSYVSENREGTRTVCDTVRENVKRKVQVCQLQPYEETVRVLVNTSCYQPCDSGCGHQGGFFRRGCCGH